MKKSEWRPTEEMPKRPDKVTPGLEKTTEAMARAQGILQKADALIGKTPPRTPAERRLHASRTKLMTWLKRLSLVGAIAGGQAGLYAGAERAGDALREGVASIGHTLGALGNIQPIRVDFGTPEEQVEEASPQIPDMPTLTATNGTPLEITINDPDAPDATVHDEDAAQSPEERQRQILLESALLIADELQSEGFFTHDHNVTEFTTSVRERLRAMGITGEGPVEQAQFAIRERYRSLVQERAQHDVEGALQMANKVNGAFGGIDTYALALEHHRPDLAADTASRTLSSYREHMRDIRTDTEYADDAQGRTEALDRARRNMVRDIFSESHSDEVPEVLRHLERDERRGLATALDTEIALLEAELVDPNLTFSREETRRRLDLLLSSRRSL